MKIRMDFVYPSKYAELHDFINNKSLEAWVNWEDILPEEFKEEKRGPVEVILLKGVKPNGTMNFQVDIEVREQLVVRKDGKGQQEEFVWTVPSSHLKALLDLLEVFPQLNVDLQAEMVREHVTMLTNINTLNSLLKDFYNADREVMQKLLREIEDSRAKIKELTQGIL